jgi:hypothetical protein
LTDLVDKNLSFSMASFFLSVATTLVTLSGKEKDLLDQQSASPSFGLGVDPSVLEPGTHP